MRFFILPRNMTLDELASSLARSPRAAAKVREHLLAANPNLADRIPKGGLVILPEGPEIKAGAGTSTGGETFGELTKRFRETLQDVARRAAEHSDARLARHAAVRDALKGAAAKRLIEGDAQLRKRLAAAEASFKAEQNEATGARKRIEEFTETARAELSRLEKRFG